MPPVHRGETKREQGCARQERMRDWGLLSALVLLKEYELEISPPVTVPSTVIASLVSGSFLSRERVGVGTSGGCRFLCLRTRQEDYEATW